jgi:hypothetical protein
MEACRPCAKRRSLEWKARHPGKWREYKAAKFAMDPDYERKLQRRWHAKLRTEILAAYGDKCKCCGETAPEFLTVDHINGGGNAHRKMLQKSKSPHPGGKSFYIWLRNNKFPKDAYRLLCMNCNWSLGKRGYCPHNRKLPNLSN